MKPKPNAPAPVYPPGIGKFLGPFYVMPKVLLLAFEGDCTAACALMYLLDQQRYFEEKGLLNTHGFYVVQEDMTAYTGIGRDAQTRAFSKLEDMGLISTNLCGLPRRKWFQLNPDTVAQNLLNIENLRQNRQPGDQKQALRSPDGKFAGVPSPSSRDTGELGPGIPASILYQDHSNQDLSNQEQRIPILAKSNIQSNTRPLAVGQHLLIPGGTQKGGDILGYEKEQILLGNIINQWPELFSATKKGTSVESSTLSLLRELATGKFLSAHRWDSTWMGGKALLLEHLPKGPDVYPMSMDCLFRLIRDSVESYLAHPPTDLTVAPPLGERISLGAWLLDDHRSAGCHSLLLRYLLHDPRDASESVWKEIRESLDPKAARQADMIIQDHLERGKKPWSDRLLAIFWSKVQGLGAWYGGHQSNLRDLDPPTGGWSSISSFAGFMRLARDFYNEEICDLWPDTFLVPKGSDWKRFVGYAKGLPAPIRLDLNAQTPEEAQAARDRYNAIKASDALRNRAEEIQAKYFREFGEPMDIETAMANAKRQLEQEIATSSNRPKTRAN